jgi:hypothetical protein
MSSRADEGLLFSVLIYWVAMLAGLALFVMPALWANGPTIIENIDPGNIRALSAARHGDGRFPVARLERQRLVEPVHLVELNARVTTKHSRRRSARAHRARARYAAERARLARKARRARIARSYTTAPRHRSHGYSVPLSAQY